MKNFISLCLIVIVFACSPSQTRKTPQAPKSITQSWIGKWERTENGYEAELEIKSIKNDSIEFSLSASSGANTGELEGIAIANDSMATYVEKDDTDSCVIHFSLAGDLVIRVHQVSGICGAGAGVTYEGNYKNALLLPKTGKEEKNMVDFGVFTSPQQDSIFKSLTGSKYDLFINSTQQVSEEDDHDSMNVKVYASGVNGLYTIMENIIMIDAENHIWAAVIDDEKVYYFTNTKQFTNSLPKTIDTWRQRFKGYKIIYQQK